MVGAQINGRWSNIIFRVKLRVILNSLKKSAASVFFQKTDSIIEWEEVTPLPLSHSTGIRYQNSLLAVGGCNIDTGKASNEIFRYVESVGCDWLHTHQLVAMAVLLRWRTTSWLLLEDSLMNLLSVL